MTRAVALKVLSSHGNFAKDYLPAPEYRVEETVKGWLADPRLEARSEAIRLAIHIKLPGLLETVRPLLDRTRVEGAGRGDANYTLTAAVAAALQAKDCPSLPAILLLAEQDPELEVRRDAIAAVETLALGRQGVEPLCPGTLPPDRIGRFVAG